MPLEAATFIDSLVPTNPANADPVQQGSDHLRLIKSSIKSSFPNISAAVTATAAQINSWEARIATLEPGAPIGAIYMWLDGAIPAEHLVLNGQAVSRTTYATLFAMWGTKYGAGNGTTTFNLPNSEFRFPIGAASGLDVGTTGGTASPTFTTAAAGAHSHGGVAGWHAGHTHSTDVQGNHSHSGATAGHALTWGQMPAHNHGVNDPGHVHHYIDRIVTGGLEANVNGNGTGGTDLDRNTSAAGTGIWLSNSGNNEAHAHGIYADGSHAHTALTGGGHDHTIVSDGTHTHTGTIADGRPPYFTVNFIVRAL